MKANRLLLLAVAGASMLTLSGCAQSGNVAAHVGDTTVSTSDVDFLTQMQCETLDRAAKQPAQGAQPVQTVPRSQVRTDILNTLVQAEVNRELASRENLSYDTTMLRNVMAQFEPVVKQAPEQDQDRFRTLVELIYRGQLQAYTRAESELAAQGVSSPTQDQVDQAVAAVQAKFRKGVAIDVNPEYGADADGVAGKVDPSLSVAVSSFAKQAKSAQPDPSWVSKLPADQRCG